MKKARGFGNRASRIGRWASGLGLAALLAGMLSGCQEKPLPPPMSLAEIRDLLNANNRQLTAIKAGIRGVSGELAYGGDRRSPNIAWGGMQGEILYAQPRLLSAELTKGEQKVAILGSNEQKYWMWSLQSLDDKAGGTCYVGAHDRWNPSVAAGVLPINPVQLGHMLGIDVIGGDKTEASAIRQSEPAERATIVQFVQARPGGGLLRELWLDREQPTASTEELIHRIRGVRVYDDRGQLAAESALADWKPVKGGTALFPGTVKIQFYLYEPVPAKDGQPSSVVRKKGTWLQFDFGGADADSVYATPSNYTYECPAGARVVALDQEQ